MPDCSLNHSPNKHQQQLLDSKQQIAKTLYTVQYHNKSIGDREANIVAFKTVASMCPLLHKRCDTHRENARLIFLEIVKQPSRYKGRQEQKDDVDRKKGIDKNKIIHVYCTWSW